MTPDQIFARWVRASLLLFALVFVYFLAADLWMPLTPQSRVMHPVVRVAPQVSGQVVSVPVTDNQHVQAGEVLFRIDPRPYELAVQQAQLALEAAERDNAGYDASLAAAEAATVTRCGPPTGISWSCVMPARSRRTATAWTARSATAARPWWPACRTCWARRPSTGPMPARPAGHA